MAKIPIPFTGEGGAPDWEELEQFVGGVRIEHDPDDDTDDADTDTEGDRIPIPFVNFGYRVHAPGANSHPTFDRLDAARLWVDVWFDVDGFDPTDVGSRGIPPSVALGGTDTLAAYLLTRNGMQTDRVAQFLGVSRTTVHAYTSRVRGRARDRREELQEQNTE